MYIPKVVCMNLDGHPDRLGREMFPLKNSFTLEMITKATQDGFKVDQPYYKINSDLWGCPECHFQACIGFGLHPLVEHYEPGYTKTTSDVKARFR